MSFLPSFADELVKLAGVPLISAIAHAKNGVRYSVPKLWMLAEELPVQDVLTQDLMHHLDRRMWKTGDGERPAISNDDAWHARKTEAADLKYPIILHPDGSILDGAHRLKKAHVHGVKTVKVAQFEDEPVEAQLEKTAAKIKPVNHRPVKSTNLSTVGYDSKRKVLDIRFADSGLYRYSGVPKNVYQNIMRAKSKGKAFHRLVRNAGFDYEKLSSQMLLERVREAGIMPRHVHALAAKKGVLPAMLEEIALRTTGKRSLGGMNDLELGRVAGQLERRRV